MLVIVGFFWLLLVSVGYCFCGCWLLLVIVVCWLLFVVCYCSLAFIVCCLLIIVCCLLSYCSLFVGYCLLVIVCCLLSHCYWWLLFFVVGFCWLLIQGFTCILFRTLQVFVFVCSHVVFGKRAASAWVYEPEHSSHDATLSGDEHWRCYCCCCVVWLAILL